MLKHIKDIFLSTADQVLGKRRNKKNKPWISKETLELTAQKRKARIENNKKEYTKLKAQVQKQIRADKRKWLDEQCKKVDEFDRRHKSKEFYRQIKMTKGNIRVTS